MLLPVRTIAWDTEGETVRVVVTGGAGFIGGNLVRALLARAEVDSVVVVDDLSTGAKDNLQDVDVTFLEGSVTDPEVLDTALAGADAVVHLAALPSVPRSIDDPLASHLANATGTLQVLEAARRAGGLHTVVASSSSVYGANPQMPKHEELRAEPLSPYGVTKLATEAYAGAYAYCYRLPVLPFRFFNVFGPLQPADHAYAAVVPAFVSAALARQPLTVHGDGQQTRDFTYVGTVSKVLADAVTRRVTSTGPVNLAFGGRVSLLELIAELESVLGHRVEVRHVDPRPGDVRASQADDSRLRALFPDVRPVPLRQGLEETVAWFREI
jgi:UDP-glucose 4-epimerase